jgi:mannose-6-phosphate isomerase-like protein (cupin superfamily)
MVTHIRKATVIPAAGNKPKVIEEFVGGVNTPQMAGQISIARMRSPGGWIEPGQTPQFDEYTLVLAGCLRVESRDADDVVSAIDVRAGESVIAPRGQWVRYSTPADCGAEYVAVCLPAFSPATVNRDA